MGGHGLFVHIISWLERIRKCARLLGMNENSVIFLKVFSNKKDSTEDGKNC